MIGIELIDYTDGTAGPYFRQLRAQRGEVATSLTTAATRLERAEEPLTAGTGSAIRHANAVKPTNPCEIKAQSLRVAGALQLDRGLSAIAGFAALEEAQ